MTWKLKTKFSFQSVTQKNVAPGMHLKDSKKKPKQTKKTNKNQTYTSNYTHEFACSIRELHK